MLVHWPDKYDSFLMEHVKEHKNVFRTELRERYDQIKQLSNTKFTNEPITETEFYMAFSAVKSRGINWPLPSNSPAWFNPEQKDCAAMAPIFDVFNHQYHGNCNWNITDEGTVQITTNQRVPADSELFVDYGQSTTDI